MLKPLEKNFFRGFFFSNRGKSPLFDKLRAAFSQNAGEMGHPLQ